MDTFRRICHYLNKTVISCIAVLGQSDTGVEAGQHRSLSFPKIEVPLKVHVAVWQKIREILDSAYGATTFAAMRSLKSN